MMRDNCRIGSTEVSFTKMDYSEIKLMYQLAVCKPVPPVRVLSVR